MKEKLFQKVLISTLFYGIRSHKKSTIEYLHEIELNGDPCNQARRNILKLKYYIDDDFEDPQFLMEWTMNQMFSPAAHIHKRTIERAYLERSSRFPINFAYPWEENNSDNTQ